MPLPPQQRQTRGTRKAVQQRAKNYIHQQAVERMLDLGRVSAEQWLNSIEVEGYEALYYNVLDAGADCTCRTNTATRIGSDPDDPSSGVLLPATINDIVGDPRPGKDRSDSFVVTSNGNPFGWGGADSDKKQPPLEDGIANDRNNYGELEISDVGQLGNIDELFEDGIDCGICLRRGLQPGWALHGHERVLLSSMNLDDTSIVDIANDQPDYIHIAQGGYAQWTVNIPKYFDVVRMSLWNNVEKLDGADLHDGNGGHLWSGRDGALTLPNGDVITLAILRAAAGTTITVRCDAPVFTHAVIEFRLVGKPLKVSLPQLQEMKDYRKFLAIPSSTLILSNVQPMCRHGDVIAIPELRLMWKVSEAQPLMLTDRYQIGWSLQARIVQRNESLWTILASELK